MKIGTINIRDKAVFLAPMEKITEPSFRYLCKWYGADLVCTEFISSDVLVHRGRKSLAKLNIQENERPVSIQIYGHKTDTMREAAIIAEQANPDIIDINFGCPEKKIVARGAGAGMLRDVNKMIEITDAVVKAVKIPVTIKTRLGWDEHSQNIVEIAERLQDVGVKAIAIHGRNAIQQYKGIADWTLIGAVKNNPRMKIPIIGNGDVETPEMAKLKFNTYGLDAIMLGRVAIKKPWIFKQIRLYLDKNILIPSPNVKDIVETAKIHFQKSIEFKEGIRSIYDMRRYFSFYFEQLPDFKNIRSKLLTSLNKEEIWTILNDIEENS